VSVDPQAATRAPTAAAVSTQGLLRAAPPVMRGASYVLIGLFMVMSAALVVVIAFANESVGFDFRGTLWEPANEIWQGGSPYPAPVQAEVQVGNPALYPPLLMFLVVPLSLLPWWLALTIWSLAGAASIVSALYVLGVRDFRCYAIALVCAPTIAGLTWGNATLLLVPLIALAWRWRPHPYRVGAVLGVAIAAKLFLWPLVFWLLGTRRYRAAAAAVAVGVASTIGPWAVIGFAGMTSYPDLLRMAESVYSTHSFSVATMLNAIGVDAGPAARGALAAGLGLAVVTFVLGRRASDEASFSTAVLAAILGSPIVWPYYFALLLVPVAIVRPRFSAIWAAVGLFYLGDRLPRPWLEPSDASPGGFACCLPDGVPLQVWLRSHAPPGLWPALVYAALATALVVSVAWLARRAADFEHAESRSSPGVPS
jgi:alpha-1,2-mannosyltransferase